MKHRILVRSMTEGRFDGGIDDIVWDDAAGTVEGSHYKAKSLNKRLKQPFPLEYGDETSYCVLQDPAHDPADFLALLAVALLTLQPPEVMLPDSLKDIEPTPSEFLTVPPGAIP